MTSAIDHLERLVGFATVSRDSNLELIEYVRADLAGLGIESRIVASEDGRKANLFATIGPADRPGIVLSGHTDVVPCEGQAWTSDPFVVRRDDGRLYGRGTADMKGFIACCLAMARDAVTRRLATPIHFAFSYDEEIGCIGVRRLLDQLAESPVKPRFCIVGEPTLMQVATAHKGKASWRVTAHGLEAHSSLAPNGVNAIHLAVDLIGRIRAMQDEIAAVRRARRRL
jgi:acetylornithine deacetylase